MVKVLVIADDFTGANDTGALLRQKGFRTFSTCQSEVSQEVWDAYDAVCMNTDSRSADMWEAKARVYRAAERCGQEDMLISKRIDSTLRGNIGKEIEGILEAVPDGWKAVVVPVCPRAGRICVGGRVLVHGVPLSKSDAARDPRTPVTVSKVADIIRRQTERSVTCISLECVHQKSAAVAKRLKEIKSSIVVIDGADMEDIREIALGCVESGIPMVCVDPGDFTLETASLRYKKDEWKKRTLLVVGSMSQMAREQLDYMKRCKEICLYPIDVEHLLKEPEAESERAKDFLTRKGIGDKKLCITTAYSKRIAVESDSKDGRGIAERIADALAKLAVELIEVTSLQIEMIFLSGGDVAQAFAERAGVEGVEPLGELSPLAVYGIIVGGFLAGMKILTKGGMIGEKDTVHQMLSCVEIINQMKQQEGK